MLLFIHGSDSLTSSLKLRKLRDRFIESHGETDCVTLDGTSITSAAVIIGAAQQLPFLGSKRMVIVKNLLASKRTEDFDALLIAFIAQVPDHTVLIFYESASADKRSKLTKALISHATTEECGDMTSYQVQQALEQVLRERNTQITPQAKRLFIDSIGTDGAKLTHDLEKIALFAHLSTKPITEDNIQTLVTSSHESDVFRLIDTLGRRDMKQATLELTHLRENGEHALYILKMIAYQFRNLVQARDILNRNLGKADLMREANMKSFPAEKALNQARYFTMDQLTDSYHHLIMIDREIKTGTQDADTAVDRLVIQLCSDNTQKSAYNA